MSARLRNSCGLAAGALLVVAGCHLDSKGTKPQVTMPPDAAPADEVPSPDAAPDRRVDQRPPPDDGGGVPTDAPYDVASPPVPPVDGAVVDAPPDRAPIVDPPRDAAIDTRPAVALRINVSGPMHVGIDYPGVWAADPGTGGVCRPTEFHNSDAINGTRDDALFEGEIYGRTVTCVVGGGTLPRGMYHVNLYLAEIYWGPGCPGAGPGTGARLFDIFLENTMVLANVDLFREAGCAASTLGTGRPVVKRFMTSITNGTLNIRLDAHVDNASIAALEIVSAF